MRSPAAIGVNDDLAAGQTSVAVGSANDKATCISNPADEDKLAQEQPVAQPVAQVVFQI